MKQNPCALSWEFHLLKYTLLQTSDSLTAFICFLNILAIPFAKVFLLTWEKCRLHLKVSTRKCKMKRSLYRFTQSAWCCVPLMCTLAIWQSLGATSCIKVVLIVDEEAFCVRVRWQRSFPQSPSARLPRLTASHSLLRACVLRYNTL